ncbi:MAG TPA: anti-sigma factor [Solirubrobacteraceae bacterium]|nr:anti-sigma factor [Solirubrobacteraceae bacterium]
MDTHTDGCGSDVAAYALGALTAAETRRFEAHLETCDLCRTDLAALRPVVDALPAAAEPVAPPPALRKRIMGVVEAEARERRRVERPERRSRFSFLTMRPLPAMAAACVLVLAGVGIGVAVLQDDEAPVYQGQCIRACGDVEMRVDDGHGTLKVEGMDQPPEGRVYQVWTQRFGEDPEPTDALFTVDKDGSASVDVPGASDRVDQVLVTDEPRGGSPEPTTAPYFAVRMS